MGTRQRVLDRPSEATPAPDSSHPYVMRISRTTVDKLGIRLYDRPSAAVAELIANSYDADGEQVTVSIPLASWLATKHGRRVVDRGASITVMDDGHGMTPAEANEYFLVVGKDRRTAPGQGEESRSKHRPVMGHKGIGKLAPFGICRRIEVWSAGGPRRKNGRLVSHFIMDYDKIISDTDAVYYPTPGTDHGKWSKKKGTRVTLSKFIPKRTPDAETFQRQIAATFGIEDRDWAIRIVDTRTGRRYKVGELSLEIIPETRIEVRGGLLAPPGAEPEKLAVKTEAGKTLSLDGWIGVLKKPFKNPEIGGIRIYARKKIVASTFDFGLGAGFTGEYTIRSYVVGVLRADWLDEKEDLIRTDRRDILWDSTQGQALQRWGQEAIKRLGKLSKSPRREQARQLFLERSGIEEKALQRFGDTPVRQAALRFARVVGGTVSRDDLEDAEVIANLGELVLAVAPHSTLLEQLHSISESGDTPLKIIAELFASAKMAELASMGQVARERLGAMARLEAALKSVENESELQAILEDAPWIIDPQWTVLSSNQTLNSVRRELREWYKREKKAELPTPISLEGTVRPDFILIGVVSTLVVVEIKKPQHAFDDRDYARFETYVTALDEFIRTNSPFKEDFRGLQIVLIADKENLSSTQALALAQIGAKFNLIKRNWTSVLLLTKKAHQAFLDARDASATPGK